MTVRPLDPESRRSSAYAAVALVLVMVAVLLAAGCVSTEWDDQDKTLPDEKYILLEHKVDTNLVPVTGDCLRMDVLINAPYSLTFDENSGMLAGAEYTYNPETDSKEPLKLLYFRGGNRYYGRPDEANDGGVVRGMGAGVFSFPRQFTEYGGNVTIESVSGDGSVALRYQGELIMLKPKERRVNVTHEMIYGDNIRFAWDNPPRPPECSEDYITTDTLYNSGVYNKKVIVSAKTGGITLPLHYPPLSRHSLMTPE